MTDGVGEYFKVQGYRKKVGQFLDVEKVIQIFAMLSCDVPAAEIGRHFAVSTQMIYHIKNGARWSWVRDELLKETDNTKIRHNWIPDEKNPKKFKCQDCGVRYDMLVMHAVCPVRRGQDNQPIYMSWKIPNPKPKKLKRSIPGANLEMVRKEKAREERHNQKIAKRKQAKLDKLRAKEERRQQLLREVEQLRVLDELRKIEEGKKLS